MPAPRILYVVAVCLAGLALALAGKLWPGLVTGPAPPLLLLLLAALAVDLGLMPIIARSGAPPLSMEWRFGGFFCGALLYFGLSLLIGSPLG